MDPARVATVAQWPRPRTYHDLQVFLGFANFYRRFIFNFSGVARPLTRLLTGMVKGRKPGEIEWTSDAEQAFSKLCASFTSAPMLRHFVPSLPIRVETDASVYALSGILTQKHEDCLWHPVAYHSRKLEAAEHNYETHDQELLAIVDCFRTWRHYLEGAQQPVEVLTDHQVLEGFLKQKALSRRQARWYTQLASIDFTISHRPGSRNPADGPSRRSDYVQAFDLNEALLPTLQAKLQLPERWGQAPMSDQAREGLASLSRNLPAVRQPDAGWSAQEERLPAVRKAEAEELQAQAKSWQQWSDNDPAGHKVADSEPQARAAFRQATPQVTVKDQTEGWQGPASRKATAVVPPNERCTRQYVRAVTASMHAVVPPSERCTRQYVWAVTASMDAYSDPQDSLLLLLRLAQQNDPTLNSKRDAMPDKFVYVEESQLWTEDSKIYVPEQQAIRQHLISLSHDDPTAGHFGRQKTYELLSRHYTWPGAYDDVQQYVKTCDLCQRIKAPRHKAYGELASLPIPQRPWSDISFDFVGGLPPTRLNGQLYDSILVIVDRYTKMALYIPTNRKLSASGLAELFNKHITLTYGNPNSIVCDRGSLFTSAYFSTFVYTMRVKLKMSTAFHPQTDGQTERTNQTLEQYLRAYCTNDNNQWAACLPHAQYAYNNSFHATIGMCPFEALYGYQPTLRPFEDKRPGEVPAARERVEQMKSKRNDLGLQWFHISQTAKRYYDKKHAPRSYAVGDQVLISTKNWRRVLQHQKLFPRSAGPYRVVEPIGKQAYRIELPPGSRIHDVFHVSLLEPYHRREGASGPTLYPGPEIVDDEEEFEVEAILQREDLQGTAYYLVRWKGYPPEYDQWVSEDDMSNAQGLISNYNQSQKPHAKTPKRQKKTPARRRRTARA